MFTFKGHTSVEIMIAVTDKDSASPGIQYVPAFGNPLKVNTVRGIPVFLNSSVFYPGSSGAALLRMGVFRTRSRANALFAGVCVCVLGYTCYPPFAYLSGFAGTALVQSGNAVLLSHISGHAASGA